MASGTSGRARDARIDRALLEAVRTLLAEVGYQRLTLAMVAERAGTNRPSLYRRWTSKAHLVHDAVFPSGAPDPEPQAVFADDLHERVRRLATSYARPEAREAVLGLIVDLHDPGERRAVLEGLQQPVRAAFRARVQEAVRDGEVRADVDPDVLLDTIIGATLQGIVIDRREPHDFAADLVALLLRGTSPP